MKKIIFALTMLFFTISLVYSAGFHTASEVLPGTFGTGNFIFDGSSNVGIGTITPSNKLHIEDGGLIIRDNSYTLFNLEVYEDGNTHYPAMYLEKSRNNTIGEIGQTESGDILGALFFHGVTSGNSLDNGAYIQAIQEGATSTRVPAAIRFGTSDGSGDFAERMRILSTGEVAIGSTSASQELDVNGDIEATAFYYSSDINLKKNIVDLEESQIDKLRQIRGVYFDWKKDNVSDIGIIAQEVEKVYPELVNTDNEGIKTVKYGNLIAPLIEATKEQQDLIEQQQKIIKEQNDKINSLLERVEVLEKE